METDIDRDLVNLDNVAAAPAVNRRRGGAWGEVFVEHRDSRTNRLDGVVVEVRTDRDVGAAVRVGRAGHEGRASTWVLSREGLTTTAEVAAATIHGAPGGQNIELTEHPARPVNQARHGVDVGDAATPTDLARRVAAGARESGRAIRSLTVTLVEVNQTMLVATADGASPGPHPVRRRLLRNPVVPGTRAPRRTQVAAVTAGQEDARPFTAPATPPRRDRRTRGSR